MGWLSENVAWQLEAVRGDFGTEVLFHGVPYRVRTMPAASNLTGSIYLPLKTLGPYGASVDDRVFVFNPSDFLPHTNNAYPVEGDELTWHGLIYVVSHATFSDIGDDTIALLIYAYRRVL